MTQATPLSGVEARTALDPQTVADWANEYHRRFVEHPDFDKFKRATTMYVDCWASYTGYPLIARWDLEQDKEPLFVEALRVLCLKAAVFTLTAGDSKAAELLVSLPVDEMTHAMIAQPTLWVKMSQDTGIPIVHQTDLEELGWEPGDFTEQCYRAAWNETPPVRYWIGAEESKRRLALLEERHERAGMHRNGRSHDISFVAA